MTRERVGVLDHLEPWVITALMLVGAVDGARDAARLGGLGLGAGFVLFVGLVLLRIYSRAVRKVFLWVP